MADSPPLYLALDQGGHATRALVFDGRGERYADAYVDIATQRRDTAHVEHDADELADSVRAVTAAVARDLGNDARRVVAAGLATQRSSIVCVERSSGRALSPVLSWQDRRAGALVDSLAAAAELIGERTGLRLSPHYGASKMRWCLDNLDAVRDAAERNDLTLAPLSCFLTLRAVGGAPVVDPANASRTLLWDRHLRRFSTTLCGLFGVDPDFLPASVASRYDYGLSSFGAQRVPLTVVTGDQSAALYAFGATSADTAYLNLGTGAFFQRPTGSVAVTVPGLLSSVVWQDADDVEYVVEGTVNGAGSALALLAEQHGTDSRTLVDAALVAHKADADVPLFLNGVGGLAAPYWLADFASDWVGGGDRHARTLAVLESIAFLLAVNLRQAQSVCGRGARLLVTGGLSRIDFLCQRIADVSAYPVERVARAEATARGLTWLTARGPSEWPAAALEQRFVPQPNPALMDRERRWSECMAARGAYLP